MGDVEAKVRCEVAAMKLVRSRTSIPVPEVVAWGPSCACPFELGPFIIMHFQEGRVLGRLMEIPAHLPEGKMLRDDVDPAILAHVYRQVARFMLELADVELPSIGTIMEEENGFGIQSGPATVKMNDIERQDGIRLRGKIWYRYCVSLLKINIAASDKPFDTATDFFEHALSLDMEHLRLHPGSVKDREDASRKYRRLKRLINSLPRFVDPAWDAGPFTLRCDGMRFGNMLVDENYNITAVLDWEWSYTAPKQMQFSPPRWLILRRPMHWNTRAPWLDVCSRRYVERFNIFVKIMAKEEDDKAQTQPRDKRGTDGESLSRLMRDSMERGLLWFHELLLAPSAHSNEAVWNMVDESTSGGGEDIEPTEEEVAEFVEWKMRQVSDFDEQQKADVTNDSRTNLLRIGIDEILKIC